MNYLRQSTASQEVLIGPFVSSTDGNTVVSGLTIANTDIKVWKTGATTVVNKNSGGATYISDGLYYMTLDATDTNVIGPMRMDVHVTGALACWTNCTVLDEAVYDVMFGTVAPSTLVAGALMGLDNDAITSAKIAAGAIGASEAPLLANLDATVSSRLATSGYIAPDNTGIGEANAHAHAIDTRLPSDPADESLLEAAIATRAVAGDAMALTTGAVDAVLDEAVEGTVTLRQALRIVLSVLAGKISGAPTGPLLFRDIGDTKDRITATVDADGNRLSVTTDAT